MKNDWNKPQAQAEAEEEAKYQQSDRPIMDHLRELQNIRPVRDREEFQVRRQDVRMSGFTLGSHMMVLGEALADPGDWKLVVPETLGTDRYMPKYRSQLTKLSNLIEKFRLEKIEFKSDGDLVYIRSMNFGWLLKDTPKGDDVEPVREVYNADRATIIRKGSAIQSPLPHQPSPRTPETRD
jgi:hypothetical protein